VSAIWIGSGLYYIVGFVGWDVFWAQGTDALGSFLEGAFAPLAFLWLVIGLFIQQKELARNNEELAKTNEHSSQQTQAIAATELNARQETFFKISENVRRQLSNIAGMLLISAKGPVGDQTFSAQEIGAFWERHSSGDDEFFSRQLLTMAGPGAEELFKDLFYGTEIRTRHSENYIKNIRRLLRLASDCDIDGIISDSLRDTAHGLLYRRMRDFHPNIEALESLQTPMIEAKAANTSVR
jgi:hypothetical protein